MSAPTSLELSTKELTSEFMSLINYLENIDCALYVDVVASAAIMTHNMYDYKIDKMTDLIGSGDTNVAIFSKLTSDKTIRPYFNDGWENAAHVEYVHELHDENAADQNAADQIWNAHKKHNVQPQFNVFTVKLDTAKKTYVDKMRMLNMRDAQFRPQMNDKMIHRMTADTTKLLKCTEYTQCLRTSIFLEDHFTQLMQFGQLLKRCDTNDLLLIADRISHVKLCDLTTTNNCYIASATSMLMSLKGIVFDMCKTRDNMLTLAILFCYLMASCQPSDKFNRNALRVCASITREFLAYRYEAVNVTYDNDGISHADGYGYYYDGVNLISPMGNVFTSVFYLLLNIFTTTIHSTSITMQGTDVGCAYVYQKLEKLVGKVIGGSVKQYFPPVVNNPNECYFGLVCIESNTSNNFITLRVGTNVCSINTPASQCDELGICMAEFYLMLQYTSVSYNVILNHFHVVKYTALDTSPPIGNPSPVSTTIGTTQYYETNVHYYECIPFIRVPRNATDIPLFTNYDINDPKSVSYVQIHMQKYSLFKCQYIRLAKCTYIFADLSDHAPEEATILSQISTLNLTCKSAIQYKSHHYMTQVTNINQHLENVVAVAFESDTVVYPNSAIGCAIIRALHTNTFMQPTSVERQELTSVSFLDALTMYNPLQLDLRDYQYAPKKYKIVHTPNANAICSMSQLDNNNTYCLYDNARSVNMHISLIHSTAINMDITLSQSLSENSQFGRTLLTYVKQTVTPIQLDAYYTCKYINASQLLMFNTDTQYPLLVGINHAEYIVPFNQFYIALWPSYMQTMILSLVARPTILSTDVGKINIYDQHIVQLP
jgi:hypothetical protein